MWVTFGLSYEGYKFFREKKTRLAVQGKRWKSLVIGLCKEKTSVSRRNDINGLKDRLWGKFILLPRAAGSEKRRAWQGLRREGGREGVWKCCGVLEGIGKGSQVLAKAAKPLVHVPQC